MTLPAYPRTKPSGVEWLGDVPEHWEVKRGRFVMRVNPPAPQLCAYLCSVAVATDAIRGAFINQHIALVRLDRRLDPRFAAYSALGDAGQLQLGGLGYGGTKLQLSLDDVKSLWICVPSLPEQAAIAAYLDEETAKLDALVGKVEQAVERLQEYRTALITAAVTGKIDVRKEVAR